MNLPTDGLSDEELTLLIELQLTGSLQLRPSTHPEFPASRGWFRYAYGEDITGYVKRAKLLLVDAELFNLFEQ